LDLECPLLGCDMQPMKSNRDNEATIVVIRDFVDEYARYRRLGEKAIQQVPDESLNSILGADTNSIAMIMRHISGNLLSRFTDFLTSDGEKPWRNREAEFEETQYSWEEVQRLWSEGWGVLESQLSQLSDDQLQALVYIRGEAWTVHGALCRSLAHVSYHVGQIVLLARILNDGNWQSLSIPRGQSLAYNKTPTKDRKPG